MDRYAAKIAELAQLDESRAMAAVEKLIGELKARGEEKQLVELLRELKTAFARHAALAPVVEVGRKEDEAAALRAAHESGITAKHAVVNPSLIRGWRARSGGTLVDRSGKRALIDLYRKVTRAA